MESEKIVEEKTVEAKAQPKAKPKAQPKAADVTVSAYDPALYPDKADPAFANDPMALTLTKHDQLSEQQILATLEALHSNMVLLRDADEAKLLHRCVSRLLEGVGSQGSLFGNGVTKVEGSRGNPRITAGAGCSVNGIAVVTATGGGLATVIPELNAGLPVGLEAYITKGRTIGFRTVADVDPAVDPKEDAQLNIDIEISAEVGGFYSSAGFADTIVKAPIAAVADKAFGRAVTAFEQFGRAPLVKYTALEEEL